MATLDGNLWEYNLARVILVDVTDDLHSMQPPLPSEMYPVVAELRIPCYRLAEDLADKDLACGFLYDWHEAPAHLDQPWYVGVVSATWQER